MQEYCKPLSYGLAYYYLDFSEITKQNPSNAISSLCHQLCSSLHQTPDSIARLFQKCNNGTQNPSISDLTTALSTLPAYFESTYIIIDALDECPRGEARNELLEQLNILSGTHGVNLLVTTRLEQDIKNAILPLKGLVTIPLQSSEVDADIELYVDKQLVQDPKLRKWPDSVKKTIQESLVAKSQGMYVQLHKVATTLALIICTGFVGRIASLMRLNVAEGLPRFSSAYKISQPH
jgi:hypothetical protein